MSTRLTSQEGARFLLHFGRVMGWLVVPLYAIGIFASYWLANRLGVRDEHPLERVVLAVGFGAFAVVGALLVAKRPLNPIGWILAAIALMAGLFPAGDSYAAYAISTRGHPDALAFVGAWVQSWYWLLLISLTFVYLPLLFPDGRLLSRRWLLVAVPPAIGTLGAVVLGALTERLSGQDFGYRIDNPIGMEGLAPVEDLPLFGVFTGLLFFGIVGAVGSVVVRFRRSRGIERQQMKWFVYAGALLLLLPVQDSLPAAIVSSVLLGLTFIALPTAIGIAVLRYRLYEIDIIINRTLVYGSLTAMLVAVYFGGIVALQRLFVALTGEKSTLAVVASTLVIAALFNPLRRRVQGVVDRRFYRRKYDAAKTLAAFGTRLREETNLDALRDEVVRVVSTTMHPAHVSLWLLPDPELEARSAAFRQFGHDE